MSKREAGCLPCPSAKQRQCAGCSGAMRHLPRRQAPGGGAGIDKALLAQVAALDEAWDTTGRDGSPLGRLWRAHATVS